eukprot:PRCOL_00005918-RA
MTLSACVDSLENARDVGAACEAAGATLDAVVEVDVGQRRCGTPTASAAADLAEAIAMGDVPGLRFKGLQCYHGGIQHVRALDARAAAAAEAHAKAREAVGACVERGIAVEYVTGGGTGTFEYELASGLYTELQPGSYFFMDGDYGRNEWESGALPEQAMWVLATVISAHEGNDYVVVDAGSKAVSTDAGPPRVRVAPSLGEGGEAPGGNADALVYACAGDEHGIISLAEGAGEGAELPRLGSKLFLAPGHVDPTTNMHKHWIDAKPASLKTAWKGLLSSLEHQFHADVSRPSMHEPAIMKLSAPEPSNACLKKSHRMSRRHSSGPPKASSR